MAIDQPGRSADELQALIKHMEIPQDYSLEEVQSFVSYAEIEAADVYQRKTPTEHLLEGPLPPELSSTNYLGFLAIRGNYADLDDWKDGMEDIVMNDALLLKILQLEGSGRYPLLRSRRTIVAFLRLVPKPGVELQDKNVA